MKKIFSILFALVVVVSLGLVMVSPVLAASREVTPGWTDITQVAAGDRFTVGLQSDGNVVAVGYNEWGQCDVGGWSEIDQVAAGYDHTAGLEYGGTVVAVGGNGYGQCEVSGWTDITQVATGGWHTVGRRSDGTVVAVGGTSYGQCDVGGWMDITQVSAGAWHTVGLEDDGTVLAVGDNSDEQCDVGNWTGIIEVAAGNRFTVGLKSDGTVVAVGNNDRGQGDVSGWTDITQVAAGGTHTVGLMSDATVVAVGNNDHGQCDVGGWTDITQVAAGGWHTVGVRSDGIVVAVGNNNFGQCGEGVLCTIDGGGTINATAEADIIVKVTGTATVIIFKYDSDPHAEALALHDAPASLGLLQDGDPVPLNIWREVAPTDYKSDTELRIEVYYTAVQIAAAEDAEDVDIDENNLRLLWRDPYTGKYTDCERGGVVTATAEDGYSGYMWVEVTNSTYPSLAQVQDSIGETFGGYGHPSTDFNGGCGMATLADITPFALVSMGIVAVWATKRKRKVS